ncbi:MAG: M20/M25/M40 family metallo-hydrolase, partial [Actinomycetota bacterium]
MTESTESVIDLARRLIRTPSQGGIDDPLPVIGTLGDWLAEHGLPFTILYDSDSRPVALLAEISGQAGPTYCLHACLDTAPIGDEESWSLPPTKGALIDGWLVGRGSADSKISVALFAHLAIEMLGIRSRLRGTLSLLFDADEHSGLFAGIKSYIAR